MENHPIPQDVTGFQFKLIGNLTIKQFAYLATGIVLAWVFLQLPIMLLIKIPFCAFSAIFGIGLAYLPVSGRPMDLMIGNFIKALFRPTQFVYQKSGMQDYFPNIAAFTTKQPKSTPHTSQNDKLKLYLQSIDATSKNIASFAPNINPSLNIPQINTFKSNNLPKPLSGMPLVPTPVSNDQKNLETEKELKKLQEFINQKKGSDQQLVSVKNNAPSASIISFAKTEVKNMQLPRGVDKNIWMPSVPDSPNLITGITKDARGNALSNILIEVKDKEGNPVRAFKTNEFGRFASATPLINGVYTIEFEDPKGQNKFESITINITGQIILPILVISIDAREELRKSLFAPPAGGLNN